MTRKKKIVIENERKILCILYGMILVLTSLITFLAPYSGFLGVFLSNIFRTLLGSVYYVVVAFGLLFGLYMIIKKELYVFDLRFLIGIIVLFIAVIFTLAIPSIKEVNGFQVLSLFLDNIKNIYLGYSKANGGLIGAFIYSIVSLFVKYVGSIVFVCILYLGAIALLVKKSYIDFVIEKFNKIKKEPQVENFVKKEKTIFNLKTKNNKEEEEVGAEEEIPVVSQNVKKEKEEIPQPIHNNEGVYNTYPNYQLPRLSLLDVQGINKSSANNAVAKQKADLLINILEQFGINSWLQNIQIGPSITRFELGVDTSTRLNKITSLQNNIAMGLSAKKVNIEAPIPGKNAVGIEIENVERNAVRLRDLLVKIPPNKENSKLLIALGKNLAGENEYGEINKMPHLLIAGSTGSGKSVCINSIIATLLFRTRPNEVKLLLIDPKKVEFTNYNDIPHLIAPVINDSALAAKALNTVVQIMDYRYEVLHKKCVKDIEEYNNKCANDPDYKYMYRLVVIIDELADLMISHGKEVEGLIQRITQLARASGIHLIVATQRPSVDVITGTIKSNIPSRIGFAVASATDSRIILDSSGAENLLGYGDMLYLPMGESVTKRIQGVYVSEEELAKVTEFVKTQGKPMYEDAFIVDQTLNNEDEGFNIDDPMFDECKKYIAQTQKASTSSLQRRFGIGYNRAARIIDALEQEGSIGPLQGSKPREVYITADDVA